MAIIRKAKPEHQKKLRPQENLWSFDLMLGCLVVLTAVFFLIMIYSILQANAAFLPVEANRFLVFKIMDTSSSATLFVTLLGALLIRHQFALGLLPRIIYTSTSATRSDLGITDRPPETWRVEIRNSGLGAAIINSTSYIIELADEKSETLAGSHSDIVQQFANLKMVRNTDYTLEKITAGFTLSPKDDCRVFEVRKDLLPKLKRLDMVMYFQGQLGGRYYKEISLLPKEAENLR